MTVTTTFGAQYYRPPNPPREDWRRDLELMKETGCNTVKLWACWSWMAPDDGGYDFADLDELMDHAGDIGLRVVINTIIENAPYRLEERLPDDELSVAGDDAEDSDVPRAEGAPGQG